MSKANMFVLHRNLTVTSLMGHTIEFRKGVETHVPKESWKDVIAVGAVPADELEEEVEQTKEVVMDPEDRKALIMAAIQEIVLKGDRESFTGNGSPHAAVVSKIAGFDVNAKERDVVWTEYRQANQADA